MVVTTERCYNLLEPSLQSILRIFSLIKLLELLHLLVVFVTLIKPRIDILYGNGATYYIDDPWGISGVYPACI